MQSVRIEQPPKLVETLKQWRKSRSFKLVYTVGAFVFDDIRSSWTRMALSPPCTDALGNTGFLDDKPDMR